MVHGDRSVDVFVRKLRQKLERASPGWRYIHTHFGIGYRFTAEPVVTETATEPAAAPVVTETATEPAAAPAPVHAATPPAPEAEADVVTA
jgi:DNA-binding winged helix-turn-helix (wHTH) protein